MKMKIAVPSNDGERISEEIIGSLLFLIYEIAEEEVCSRTKRAQLHGIMATVDDCDIVISKNCPEPIRKLLAVKGIQTVNENRIDADRAVYGLLNREIRRTWEETVGVPV